MVVTGGSDGVATTAEQAWRAFGGEVVSYRPAPLTLQSWTVHKVVMGEVSGIYRLDLMGHPTWEEFDGAAFYRSMLMADECERAVCFHNGVSRGTKTEVDLFQGRKKPVHRMEV